MAMVCFLPKHRHGGRLHEAGVMNSILADEIEAEAGDHLDIEDLFKRRVEPSSLRHPQWRGHAHEEEGEEEEHEHGLVLPRGTDWVSCATSISRELKPKLSCTSMCADCVVFGTSSSIWSMRRQQQRSIRTCTSKTATCPFTLTSVGGGSWWREPTWAAGTDVVVEGSVTDSDGIASAELELIDEPQRPWCGRLH